MKLLRKTYDWILDKSNHPKAPWFLSFISFIESSFFPIPPDVILIPMIIANKMKAWWYAFICTVSSVLGGIFGYYIGYFFYATLGIIIIKFYSLENKFFEIQSLYDEFGLWFVFIAGLTFLPFKIVTIGSGLFHLNILKFIMISLIARGLRFYLVATLLKYFGYHIKIYIDRYFNTLTVLFFIILIGSFIFLKYL